MSKYLLAHDLGTSGNKATLYTTDGELVKSSVYSYDTNYFNQKWAEQDAEDWWQAVCSTTREILAGIDHTQVVSISFSGQMQGCLCVDKNGKPLRKSIIWADQRAHKEADLIREKLSESRHYKITGHRISPAYSLFKLMWIKENQPHIYENTYKMLNAKDYIILKLTGAFVTDYSDASGTCIFDINEFAWSKEMIGISGIEAEKLPDLKPSTYVVGGVTAEAAQQTGLALGTKVVCGGGDGACAAVGAGCVKEGLAFNYIGSSSWIALTTKQPVYDEQMRTFNFAHIVPGAILPCGTMQSAGGAYHWLKNEICTSEAIEAQQKGVSPYQLIDEKIAQAPSGANGVIFLPYLLGERSPRWNPDASAAFIGLKMEHKRSDILRAVLEGITMNLNIILGIFSQHVNIDEMVVIGGGAKGDVWRQMMADIYQLKILKPNDLEEATSMGAAITGGVGVGVFENFDVVDRFTRIESSILPIAENVRVYQKLMPIFDESYHALVGIYEKLAELSKKN